MNKIKTSQERDTLDLLQLVCQLHSRCTCNMSIAKEVHDSYKKARTELEKRIKATPEWIDVKDMPFCGDWVLAISNEDGGIYYHVAQCVDGKWYDTTDELHFITHWQELPEKPKTNERSIL